MVLAWLDPIAPAPINPILSVIIPSCLRICGAVQGDLSHGSRARKRGCVASVVLEATRLPILRGGPSRLDADDPARDRRLRGRSPAIGLNRPKAGCRRR